MSKIYLITVLSFLSITMSSQEILENSFYSLNVPQKTLIESFGSTNEEYANIDVYKFKVGDKPKYILYLMSNKINKSISLDISNYQDFLYDIGKIKVTEVKDLKETLKVIFSYEDKEYIKGVLYMSIKGDILNRFLFLLPNESTYFKFETEIDKMVSNIIYLKENW